MNSTRTLLAVIAQLLVFWLGGVAANDGSKLCVLLRDCQSAWSLRYAELRSRICGYDNRYPKIWCDVPCVSPDSERGVCTSVNKCPTVLDFVKKSNRNDSETTQYLRKFICASISNAKQHYVCCQDKPLKGIRPVVTPTPAPNPYKPNSFERYKQQCGVASDQYKVVGGTYADLGDHPWVVLLEYLSKGKFSFKCGGALINERYVLTAGHCINDREGKLVHVVLGEHNTSSPIDCYYTSCAPKPKVIGIERVTQHPGWINGRPQ
ncbi:Trypsin, partial [Oryctes borbonicus]